MKKYKISWDLDNFHCSWFSYSKVKTFAMVYGVYCFQIKFGKVLIKSDSFIDNKGTYDSQYHYFLQCFLIPKQINKVYELILRKDSNI